jgi:methionyl aminopeptidase
MITIYSKKEIENSRESGKILAAVLREVAQKVEPGVSTKELDSFAYSLILEKGAEPAFLHYQSGGSGQFPASLCTSINEEIVHCVPASERKLKNGDIITLDLGVRYKGMVTDMAITVPVGKASDSVGKLMFATNDCLNAALKVARAGVTTGDIGHAIEKCAEVHGFAVVRDLVGHGVGHNVHEEPQVPNYGKPGSGAKLKSGMVLAIEPMLTLGRGEIKMLADDWGIATADGSISAHFEKTVAISDKGCEVLTK